MLNSVENASQKREVAQGPTYRTFHYLGVISLRRDRAKQAESYFRESLKLNTHNGVTLAYLGHALWKQGRLKEAAGYYREFESYWGQNATISKRINL